MSVDRKRASRFPLASTATFTALQVHVDGRGASTGSQSIRGVVYSDASGAPYQPLATTESMAVTAGRAAGQITLSFSSPVRLASGQYWLGLHSGGPTAVARYAATTVSNALRFNTGKDAFSDGSSNPFGTTNTDNKQMSIAAIGTLG